MRLLDLFCGAGGCAMGYHLAGFDEIVGVDIAPQPRYPFTFVQADALGFCASFGAGFDAIHASPPCQAYTNAQRIQQRDHPDIVDTLRRWLIASGRPYVIENVPGSPLRDAIELCGHMFGLALYRHRWFETSFRVTAPEHPPHVARQAKMGRAVKPGEVIQVVGNFSGVQLAREAMGIPWMVRDELREAIPPAYTEFIGRQVLQAISKSSSAPTAGKTEAK